MYRRKAIQNKFNQQHNKNSGGSTMNFDFNIGAIVKLGILGTAKPIYRIGKVIEVTPTEVVIIPQLHVYRKKSDDYSAHLDEYCTADAFSEVIHIRRQLIASWTYSKATDIIIKESISDDNFSFFSSKSFSEYTLNSYDNETGLCKGNGTNCRNIEESTTPFFFIQTTSANDGIHHELSHCRF